MSETRDLLQSLWIVLRANGKRDPNPKARSGLQVWLKFFKDIASIQFLKAQVEAVNWLIIITVGQIPKSNVMTKPAQNQSNSCRVD